LRTEDVDLALFLPLVENKVLGMAESIQDGDDPVQQFAQFLPRQDAMSTLCLPSALSAAEKPTPPAGKPSVGQQGRTVWQSLQVPGFALVIGVVGFVVGRYRFRRR
jgi:hypothetical protein